MMPVLGTVVIFIKLPIMYWHFDAMLNASVMVAQVAMRVYMFHSREFHAPIGEFKVYPTNGESDSDTQLTLTFFVESYPSESSYHISLMPLGPDAQNRRH